MESVGILPGLINIRLATKHNSSSGPVATHKPVNETATYDGAHKGFLNYTFFTTVVMEMEVTSLYTSVLLVCGVFSNLIAIGVFSSPVFNRMAFKVYMKILCCLNLVVLFLGMVWHHTFMLDIHDHVSPESRRYGCTYLRWFVLVFENCMACSIALILYNRIKAQRNTDSFLKTLESMREPVLLNTTQLLLNTAPVSSHIDSLDELTSRYNRTECSFTYLHPYRPQITPDVVMSNLALLQEVVIIIMFILLIMEVALRHRRDQELLREPHESISSLDLPSPERAGSRRASAAKRVSRATAAVGAPLKGSKETTLDPTKYALHNQSTLDVSRLQTSLLNLADHTATCSVTERDKDMSLMAVVVVAMYILTGTPRRVIHASFLLQNLPDLRAVTESFTALVVLDLIYYTYLAGMFLVLCVSSPLYRREAKVSLFDVRVDNVYANMSLVSTTRMVNDLFRPRVYSFGSVAKRFRQQPDDEQGKPTGRESLNTVVTDQTKAAPGQATLIPAPLILKEDFVLTKGALKLLTHATSKPGQLDSDSSSSDEEAGKTVGIKFSQTSPVPT